MGCFSSGKGAMSGVLQRPVLVYNTDNAIKMADDI